MRLLFLFFGLALAGTTHASLASTAVETAVASGLFSVEDYLVYLKILADNRAFAEISLLVCGLCEIGLVGVFWKFDVLDLDEKPLLIFPFVLIAIAIPVLGFTYYDHAYVDPKDVLGKKEPLIVQARVLDYEAGNFKRIKELGKQWRKETKFQFNQAKLQALIAEANNPAIEAKKPVIQEKPITIEHKPIQKEKNIMATWLWIFAIFLLVFALGALGYWMYTLKQELVSMRKELEASKKELKPICDLVLGQSKLLDRMNAYQYVLGEMLTKLKGELFPLPEQMKGLSDRLTDQSKLLEDLDKERVLERAVLGQIADLIKDVHFDITQAKKDNHDFNTFFDSLYKNKLEIIQQQNDRIDRKLHLLLPVSEQIKELSSQVNGITKSVKAISKAQTAEGKRLETLNGAMNTIQARLTPKRKPRPIYNRQRAINRLIRGR